MHDTLLSTMAAIAHGVQTERLEDLRDRCGSDIARWGSVFGPPARSGVDDESSDAALGATLQRIQYTGRSVRNRIQGRETDVPPRVFVRCAGVGAKAQIESRPGEGTKAIITWREDDLDGAHANSDSPLAALGVSVTIRQASIGIVLVISLMALMTVGADRGGFSRPLLAATLRTRIACAGVVGGLADLLLRLIDIAERNSVPVEILGDAMELDQSDQPIAAVVDRMDVWVAAQNPVAPPCQAATEGLRVSRGWSAR